jgi:hypothetical protein
MSGYKVGYRTIDFRQRRSHGVKIEEIAIDDLGAALLQFS